MRIACIHQGWELYGSDRSFAESVAALREAYPEAEIEVVLPRPGPIVDILQPHATRILFEPLWILRRKALLRLATVDVPRLPISVLRALRRIQSFDLVYVNTSVIVDYALAARFSRDRTILHIHEIPEGLALTVLGRLIGWSRSELIFNSKATRDAFGDPKAVLTHVVYNGVEGPAVPLAVTYDGTRPLRVLLLGRINRIKGQDVLLDAIAAMPPSAREKLEVRIVGSAFDSDEPERELRERIERLGLQDLVTLLPFIPDPSEHYAWADVVTVPSKRPESLGRVAIEAMAWGRPVIASAIGGLMEVVETGRTGWTLPPGDPHALKATLLELLDDPAKLVPFAAAGRLRYENLFSRDAVSATIGRIAGQKFERRGIAGAFGLQEERGAAE